MRRTWILGAVLALSSAGTGESAAERSHVENGADAPMDAHPEEVASYTLRAKLDPTAHTVHGEGTIKWKNASTKPVNELWVHLYLNAFKNQSSVFMREPVGGFRGATKPDDWGTIDVRKLSLDGRDLWPTAQIKRPNDEDETDAQVPLPHEVKPGETIELQVEWDDKLPTVVERTGYDGTFHMVAQWFPKIARLEPDGTFAHFPFHHLAEFYADYGTYDVTLDVPQDYIVGACGLATETKSEGGRSITRFQQADIHDFAWTAWNKWKQRKETIDGVAVSMLYPPGYDTVAERELDTMRFALPHFSAKYGRYPYGTLTMVHPPNTVGEAGGMEYPTLITTGGSAFTPKGFGSIELVTIHEFGHQYFYGLLGSNEVEWPFMDEGLNSYAEAEALGAWKGRGSFMNFLGLQIDDAEGHAAIGNPFVHDDRVAQAAYTFGSGNGYGRLVYSRTAAILHTLRRVYGTVEFDRAMGVYTREFRFKHPAPNDFIEVIRRELNPEAAEVLRAALFDKAWVDYAVTSISSYASHAPAGLFDHDGKRETVEADKKTPGKYQGWALVVRRGNISLPVEIELIAEDGGRTRVPWDGVKDTFRVPYTGSSPLRSVVVDPDHRILFDQDPTNDFMTAGSQKQAGAPRVLDRATWYAGVLAGMIGP